MKHIITFLLLCSLYSFVISLTSCEVNGQSALQRETETKPTSAQTCQSTCSSPQIADNIFEIFEDDQGTIWFGTDEKGVAKFDGKSLTYITEKDGLCGKTVADLAQDNEGNIWLGTYSDMCIINPGYVNFLESTSFKTFEKNGEVPHLGYGWKSVKTDPEGTIWVNTHHGIFQYVNGDFVEFPVPASLKNEGSLCSTPGGISFDLTDSQGNMWFSTDQNGAYVYNGTTFINYTDKDGLSSNSVMGIAEDKEGNIWFACREQLRSGANNGGLTMFDGKAFHNFKNQKGLHNNNINTIYSDLSGNIWIGATGTGVYKYNGMEFTLYPEPKEVTQAETIHVRGLQSMLEDSKGNYWFGFSGGLFKIENGILVNVTRDKLEC